VQGRQRFLVKIILPREISVSYSTFSSVTRFFILTCSLWHMPDYVWSFILCSLKWNSEYRNRRLQKEQFC